MTPKHYGVFRNVFVRRVNELVDQDKLTVEEANKLTEMAEEMALALAQDLQEKNKANVLSFERSINN